MQEVSCPVCDSPTYRRFPALLDPFIADRCNIHGTEACTHLCGSCGHIFRTPFLSGEQLSMLYSGYRNADYNRLRLAVEPGYIATISELEDHASSYWNARLDFYDSFLPDLRTERGVVVDFGGGDGFFSRYIFPEAETHVVEESFEREGGDLPGLLGRTRILFCAQVFEHIPKPLETLRKLSALLGPGAQIWIDVPNDHLRSPEQTFTRFERASRDGTLGWESSVVIFHEHVSNFCPSSLRVLLDRADIEPCLSVLTPSTLGILGRKRPLAGGQ